MTVQVDTQLALHGLPAIELDNSRLRVLLLPTAGGRIWQVQCLRSGRRVLWNNPRIPPASVPTGATFDDCFSGGWDVLFPNDAPETLAGEDYPDHGELWTASWGQQVHRHDDGSVEVEMQLLTPISQCLISKRVRLAPNSDVVEISETVSSQGRVSLPALWKHHLALALDDDGDRLVLPSATAELADWGRPRAGAPGDRFDWPVLHGVDLSAIPSPDDPAVEFQYLTDLGESTASLERADGSGVSLSWQSEQLTTLWLFASYGAWRGIRTVVLEPCTGTPLSVMEGVASGTHRSLEPGDTWTATLQLRVWEGQE